MNKDIVSTTLRLPQSLLAELKHKAIDNRRSLNAEMLRRLEETVRKEENAAA